jgi:putative membrane protein
VVLDAVMAQPPPPAPERTGSGTEPPAEPAPRTDLDQARRTSMAAERTWLAWWRTALAASAGALAVGRLAPDLLDVAPWPYVLLGCGYASLAIGLLLVGAQRQRDLEHAMRTGGHVPLRLRTVGVFTAGGVALAVLTAVLVIAQT